MRCGEVNKFIHAYVDGEFEARELGRLEEHLQGCTSCRQLAHFEGWFIDGLRRSVPRPRAPVQLRSRILAEIQRAPVAPGRGLMRWQPALPTPRLAVSVSAAAACLAAFLWWDPALTQAPPEAPMRETFALHRSRPPVEVRGPNDKDIQRWYHDKLPFAVDVLPLHRLGPVPISLVGGRLSHVREHAAAHLIYDLAGTPLSVMVYRAPELRPPRRSRAAMIGQRRGHIRGEGGLSMLTFRKGDVTYTVTSALPPNQIIELVSYAVP